MLEDMPNACRVLDAPAGNARMAERLALNGHTVVCGDVLAPPASLPANVRYQQMDLNEPLPFPDESFDVVVSNEGLQYIRRPYDLIHEFGRVLSIRYEENRVVVDAELPESLERRLRIP